MSTRTAQSRSARRWDHIVRGFGGFFSARRSASTSRVMLPTPIRRSSTRSPKTDLSSVPSTVSCPRLSRIRLRRLVARASHF